jgi:hypothetical protein
MEVGAWDMSAKVVDTVSSFATAPAILGFTLVVVVSCAVMILGLEAATRLLLSGQVASWRAVAFGDQRVSFISRGAFQNRAGYPAYRPDSEIREVAYYPDSDGTMTREYDCTYRSDRLGFLSNSIRYEEAEILLLGDSNAQGQGGCAWLPRLSHDVRSRVYSTAVFGHGVKHWRNVLVDLEKIRTPPKVMIIFITDDFFRTDWVFDDAQLACITGDGDCRGMYWHPLSDNMAEQATETYARRDPGSRTADLKSLTKYHLIATYTLLRMIVGRQQVERRTFGDSLEILGAIADKYPLKLIWVNEHGETAGPGPRTRLLEKRLQRFDVTRCSIPLQGFLPRDRHPNRQGYDVLKSCVEQVVRGW